LSGKVVTARSITSIIHFHCADDILAERLSFIAAEPHMPEQEATQVNIGSVILSDDYYDFTPPHDGFPGTCEHMLNRAHQILRDAMLVESSRAPIAHAASVVVNDRRFLIMADKGSGKTTLCLRCLAEGFAVEGDEHVIIGQKDVLARPRTLRIKQGSLAHAPELEERIRNCPAIADWDGNLIYSIAPQTHDSSWTIKPGPADVLLFLTPNHGGLTSTKLLSPTQAFERLMKTVFLPETGKSAALACLHNLTRTAESLEMRLGCLKTAAWHLRQLSRS
jgi:hypothetical protein